MEDQGLKALRSAAHDLRNPLTVIKTLALILKNHPERLERNIDMLLAQVDKLADLSEILIDTSRADRGRLKIESKPEDLRLVLKALVVTLELPEEPLEWSGDRAALRRALQFFLRGTETASLKLERTEKGARITIHGQFSSTPQPDDARVYIAQKIIEAHGGRVSGRWVVDLPLLT